MTHPDNCNCQICGSLWFLSQNGDEALQNIRHFFATGEMMVDGKVKASLPMKKIQ